MTDDVVVVGGRCAGAPTATLLARAGLSIRLLERSACLGDVVSGHLVIGADGRNSRIARLAGAKTYHDHPPVTFAYYTYWRGCPVTGVHAWLEPGRFFGIFPVGGGLALAFVQGPRGEYPTFRSDPLTAYISELRSRPALSGLLGDAVIAEQLRGTAALPTFFRNIVRTGLGAGR